MISKKLKGKHKMVKDEMSNVGEINQLRNRIGQ